MITPASRKACFIQFAVICLMVLILGPSATLRATTNQSLRNEFDKAISKWVARDSKGQYYVLSILPDGQDKVVLGLRVAKVRSAASIEDFSPPVEPPFPVAAGDRILSGGMVIDPSDRLHLVVSTERGWTGYSWIDLKGLRTPQDLRHSSLWHNPRGAGPGPLVLAPTASRVGDITLGPRGEVWLTWTTTEQNHRVTVYLGERSEKGWHAFKISEGYGIAPPSLLIDTTNHFHLAWHDIYEDVFGLSGPVTELGSQPNWEAKKLTHDAWRPVMAQAGEKTLSVLETNYSYLDYLSGDENQPKRYNFSKNDPRFVWDISHSPQFATDRYGIPWVFFIDDAREHVFYARWLGSEWSDIYDSYWLTRNKPRGDVNHLSVDRLAVEERMAPNAPGIGVAVENETSSSPQIAFHLLPVPALEAKPGKKVLFLDMAEVKELDGLVLNVNEAKKYDGNPVLDVGGPDDFDSQHAGGQDVTVLKENGVYRMWYSAWRKQRGEPWWIRRKIGYAESHDGYKYERVKVNDEPHAASEIPGLPWMLRAPLFKDPFDPNPQRRYKLLTFPPYPPQDEEAKAGDFDPWNQVILGKLFTSADGIHWSGERTQTAFAGQRPNELMPLSFFFDPQEKDPAKRYKGYGYLVLDLSRRGASYSYSADAVHWTGYAQNPVLDPFARDIPVVHGGKVDQIHDMVAWQDGGYYLALYDYQHDGGHLDVELAASRDGEHFVFVKPGEKVIPMGPPGSFDCGIIFPSVPLLDSNDIKLYYGAGCGDEEAKGPTGLATLRLDGYTDLQLAEKRHKGSFTTIPISRGSASQLVVNADCGVDGNIEMELINPASGQPLPGYSREEAVRVSGDVMAHPVQWKQQSDFRSLAAGQFQIKVYFSGGDATPKLYSFGFK